MLLSGRVCPNECACIQADATTHAAHNARQTCVLIIHTCAAHDQVNVLLNGVHIDLMLACSSGKECLSTPSFIDYKHLQLYAQQAQHIS